MSFVYLRAWVDDQPIHNSFQTVLLWLKNITNKKIYEQIKSVNVIEKISFFLGFQTVFHWFLDENNSKRVMGKTLFFVFLFIVQTNSGRTSLAQGSRIIRSEKTPL